jgi:hypothetical protein
MAHLQLEIRQNGAEVGVAAPLAIAIHTTLHVRCSGIHGGECIGDGDIGIVVSVNADYAGKPIPHQRDDFCNPMRQRAAIGVAEAENIRARLMCRLQGPQRKIGIGIVAIEEMLGIVDDFAAVLLQILDRLPDQQQILFFRNAERAPGMKIPTTPTPSSGSISSA